MRHYWMIVPAVVLTSTVLLASCSQLAPYEDLEDVEVRDPDKAVILTNANEFPNLSIVCFEGDAIVTTTRPVPPVHIPDSAFCSE